MNTPNTPQELMNLNTPEPTTPTVENVMELIGEMTPSDGMEITLKCLEILRNIHTNTGLEKMENGEKNGFIWLKDGVTIHNCIQLLEQIDMG